MLEFRYKSKKRGFNQNDWFTREEKLQKINILFSFDFLFPSRALKLSACMHFQCDTLFFFFRM